MKKLTALILSIIMLLLTIPAAFAANPVEATEEWLADWETRINYAGKIWQTPGETENDRVFTWLSDDKNNTFTYSDGKNEYTVTADTKISVYGMINTVKLNDLPDGKYSYSYTANGEIYDGKTFSVAAESDTFTAMFCSDPQLGRSGDNSEKAVQDDTYGWERTLSRAKNKGAELILSAGDQVNDGFSSLQYSAFFSPETLSSIPIAPTAGNHDFYSYRFGTYFGNAGVNAPGNDYYFSYGNALFIVLDSNNIISPIHKHTISEAVKSFPDAAWRVVMLHHGAYSAGADEFTNKICAGTLKDIFDKYDIDLVLSGHNHFYSRTYPIYNGAISTTGSVYFEAGSASGGKLGHYDSVNADYIVHSVTLDEASYSLLTFTEDTINISSYLTDSDTEFDNFTVVRTGKTNNSVGLLARIISFFSSILSYIPMPI